MAVEENDETTNQVTADSLIETFGDQAYHRGVRMVLDAMEARDAKTCRALSQANIELIRRGYDKKPEKTAHRFPWRFVIEDGRHEYVAALMLGHEALLVAWVEAA